MNTVDAMTAEVPELDWALLKKITERILNEVAGHLPRVLRLDAETLRNHRVGIGFLTSSNS